MLWYLPFFVRSRELPPVLAQGSVDRGFLFPPLFVILLCFDSYIYNVVSILSTRHAFLTQRTCLTQALSLLHYINYINIRRILVRYQSGSEGIQRQIPMLSTLGKSEMMSHLATAGTPIISFSTWFVEWCSNRGAQGKGSSWCWWEGKKLLWKCRLWSIYPTTCYLVQEH